MFKDDVYDRVQKALADVRALRPLADTIPEVEILSTSLDLRDRVVASLRGRDLNDYHERRNKTRSE
jgi:hypothetical protein